MLKLCFLVAVLEARKLKKMDITGASDPYVKLKLFDSKVISEIRWSANHSSFRLLPLLGIKITILAEMPSVAKFQTFPTFWSTCHPPGR